MGRSKCSPAVLDRIAELWRTGVSSQMIQRRIIQEQSAAGEPVAYRTVRKWMRKVEQKLAPILEEEAKRKRPQMHAALEAFLERAIDKEDLRAQGVALERLCKFFGLDGAAKIDLAASVTSAAEFADPEQAEAYVVAFLRAHPELLAKATKPEGE